MNDLLSIESAIAEANSSGWNLYALYQTDPDELAFHPASPRWRCTLRALSGPPRREIANGRGDSAILAIYNALGSAPELEAEVSCVDLRELDAEPTVDLMKLIVKREPINRRL